MHSLETRYSLFDHRGVCVSEFETLNDFLNTYNWYFIRYKLGDIENGNKLHDIAIRNKLYILVDSKGHVHSPKYLSKLKRLMTLSWDYIWAQNPDCTWDPIKIQKSHQFRVDPVPQLSRHWIRYRKSKRRANISEIRKFSEFDDWNEIAIPKGRKRTNLPAYRKKWFDHHSRSRRRNKNWKEHRYLKYSKIAYK